MSFTGVEWDAVLIWVRVLPGHEVGMGHLQQGHGHQQGQWDQQDQQDPGEKRVC